MWTLFEPVHAVTYFAPAALEAYKAAGLRGFWRGYFAGRAAPLGAAGPAAVTASFYNFAPSFVARAVPGVWELISPDDALRVRSDGAMAALRELLAGRDAEVKAAAGLLDRALDGLDYPGRVLSAANGALDGAGALGGAGAPGGDGEDLGRLWQATTTLREHRGDGHFAALVAADVDGCEVLVLRCGLDMDRATMQPIRGWTDDQWDAARGRLAGRGLIDADGTITDAGREVHAAVEAATDQAAERPWARLGEAGVDELAEALLPLAVACAQVVPYPSPIGVPRPS
jgi:helix-turn-helix protein